jgi:hypothetical protein
MMEEKLRYTAEQVRLAHVAQFYDQDMRAQEVDNVEALGMFITSPEDDPEAYRREVTQRQQEYEAGKAILKEAVLVYGRKRWVIGTGHTAHIISPVDSPEIAIPRGFAATQEQFVWCCLRHIDESDLITVTEAAEILGVTTQAVSNRIAVGDLIAIPDADEPNPTHRTRVLRSEVEALQKS